VQPIQIAYRLIGSGQPCFVIAEAGINHNGSLERALKLVDVAKAAGADAVKFQLYCVDEQVSKAAQTAGYQRERTGAYSMIELAKSYDLAWANHKTIAKHCRDVGIEYMASCFDAQAVDFLVNELDGDCIKVGSGEITNYPLLAHMARTGKAMLLSTGMSTLADVAGAIDHIQANGAGPLGLFQCTSNYPTEPEAVNLRAMRTMAHAFSLPVGFSDHTRGYAISVAAVAMGATMIEKHFTLDKKLPGPDHAMSLDPAELGELVSAIRITEAALGDGIKRPHSSEIDTQRAARRSLVSTCTIQAGERLTETNVALKRPATGIDPRFLCAVRGRTAACTIPADIPITWEMLM
jgi:N,N'-diacetyllegionaminate synthase